MSMLASVSASDYKEWLNTLTSVEKQAIEKRLDVFLMKVDSFDTERQIEVYQTLQSKIWDIQARYQADSKQAVILWAIDDIAIHKIENQWKYTNEDILEHVFYNKQLQTVNTQSDENEGISEETEPEEETPKVVYNYTQDLNEYEKDILAGDSLWVVSYGVRANLESIDVETLEFTFNQNVDNIGLEGSLYLNGVFIGKSLSSDISGTKMSFENLTNLIIPEKTAYLQLELFPEIIWKDRLGEYKSDLKIINVSLTDAKGVTTWDTVWNKSFSEDTKAFNIVPVKLFATVESEFEKNKSTAKLRITPDEGENNENWNDFNASLEEIDIKVTSFDVAGDVFVYNSQWVLLWSININSSWTYTIPLTSDLISSRWESYSIETTLEGVLHIPQDGIRYSAGSYNIETKLGKNLFLGQR